MKQLVGLLMLLFAFMLSGCGDNEIAYVTDDDLLTKNNIMDVVSVFERESVEENTSIIYYGYRKGREWFALFDAKSGLLKEEWYGKEWFFEGMANMPSDIRPHLFEKLENNEYVFTYYSQSENAELLVFLSDGKSVRYELVLEDFLLCDVIDGRNFIIYNLDGSIEICDLDWNVLVEDVRVNTLDSLGIKSLYTGFQDDKVWIGYYDKADNFQEVIGKEKFERNRKFHIGYGEYEEYYVKDISVTKLIQTDLGYVFSSCYTRSIDVFFIHKDKLVSISVIRSTSDYENSLRNWYNESVLVDNKYVFSSEGKSIVELSGFINDDDELVSYREAIRFEKGGNEFSRYDYVENKNIWQTKIEKLESVQSNVRITMTLLEKREQLWEYRCDIINEDGSKSNFKFKLNVNTSEVTYL